MLVGVDAVTLGLIDEVGGLSNALRVLEKLIQEKRVKTKADSSFPEMSVDGGIPRQ